MPRILAASYVFLALAAAAADAATLRLSHPYGELIDRDPVVAQLEASPNQLDCMIPPAVARGGNLVTVTVRRVATATTAPICIGFNQVSLGELSTGWWTVVLRILDVDGTTLVDRYDSEWKIGRPDTLCNRHPDSGAAVIAEHRTLTGAQLAAKVASDAAYAASLRNPIEVRPFAVSPGAVLRYPTLENPHDLRASLLRTGEFDSVFADGLVCAAIFPPTDLFGLVVEYYHAVLGHYFYAVNELEIAGLDSGTGAKGWTRTGKSFRVLVRPGCPADRHDQAAFRFFGKPGVGPSSHVFTVDREECRIVDRSGAWLFEGSPFWATPPDSRGGCARGDEVPLHRVWKPFGDSNHRFTTELAVVDEMKSKGWVDEGVAMCVKK